MGKQVVSIIACLMATGLVSSLANAQQQALTREALQSVNYPRDNYVSKLVLVTIAPNAVVGRHKHPGIEMGYVIAGVGTLSIDGQPERLIKAGDSFAIPEGVVHGLRNTGNRPEQIVSTYVVERNKPLATPSP
jgi:quercetin dioxygenase-like cupin family protein